MKTLAEIRLLTANTRQQLCPPAPGPAQRPRHCFAALRERAAQRVLAAAKAGEYSYLERLYGQYGCRTAPAGGGYSSRVITLKWN